MVELHRLICTMSVVGIDAKGNDNGEILAGTQHNKHSQSDQGSSCTGEAFGQERFQNAHTTVDCHGHHQPHGNVTSCVINEGKHLAPEIIGLANVHSESFGDPQRQQVSASVQRVGQRQTAEMRTDGRAWCDFTEHHETHGVAS